MSSMKAEGTVQLYQREERAPNDFLGRRYEPLRAFFCATVQLGNRTQKQSVNMLFMEQCWWTRAVIPEDSQEEDSLSGLLKQLSGV